MPIQGGRDYTGIMSPARTDRGRQRAGRPPASSPGVLEEAAVQLYLEQGFAATTIDQITARAGVARSSFFNYFRVKADVLWAGFDAAIARLNEQPDAAPAGPVVDRIAEWADGVTAENVALLFTQAEPMGLKEETVWEAVGVRIARLATVLRRRFGLVDIVAYSYAAAMLMALAGWSHAGAVPGGLGKFFRVEIERLRYQLTGG